MLTIYFNIKYFILISKSFFKKAFYQSPITNWWQRWDNKIVIPGPSPWKFREINYPRNQLSAKCRKSSKIRAELSCRTLNPVTVDTLTCEVSQCRKTLYPVLLTLIIKYLQSTCLHLCSEPETSCPTISELRITLSSNYDADYPRLCVPAIPDPVSDSNL